MWSDGDPLQEQVVSLAEMNQVLNELVETQREDIANLEGDLRSYRAKISRLRKKQDDQLRSHPSYDAAMNVLTHWKAVCSPSARELTGGDRLKNCMDRLAGSYTVEELKRSCDGYALQPYVVNGRRTHDGSKDSWQADAELIFRDPRHVDQGLRIMARAADLRTMFADRPAPVSRETTTGDLSELGRAALRIAGTWSVFPCKPRSKDPATRHGLLDAKREPQAIRQAWLDQPQFNIGVPAGAANGFVVLDVDGDDGWDSYHQLEDTHGSIPDTLSVHTPGGGQHFYFTHPGVEIRNTTGYPLHALDVRGDGGYVLVPPSIGSGGRRYEKDLETQMVAMPDWLVEMLVKRQQAEVRQLQGGKNWAEFLATSISVGERNSRMASYTGHMLSRGHSLREVWQHVKLLNSSQKDPLSAKELEMVVRSIGRRHTR